MRAIVGVAALWHTVNLWSTLNNGLRPEFFQLPMVAGLPRIGLEGVPLLVGLWGIAAAAFCLGWFMVPAGVTLTLLGLYVVLLDQTTYSNHTYLLTTVIALLTLARGGQAPMPTWPVNLLKTQLSVVYAFAGVSKLNLAYLSGAVLKGTMAQEGLLAWPAALRIWQVLMPIAVGTVALELWLAWALWQTRHRRRAAMAGLVLHAGMVFGLYANVRDELVVFAATALALYLLFFDMRPQPVRLIYDDGCGICSAFARWLARVGGGRVTVQGASLEDSMIVEWEGGRVQHAAAIAVLSRAFPPAVQLLRVVSWPGIDRVITAGYALFARHRHRVSAWVGLDVCAPSRGSQPLL